MGSILGRIFRISTFGESHGKAVGVSLDGCPAGISIDEAIIQQELNRRRPGQSSITTSRDEKDQVKILSGVFEGKTLGSPITLLVTNKDQKSDDYLALKNIYRPSHADFTYDQRYHFRDWRGGGRSSNRESVARVAAGAIAKQLIYQLAKIETIAWVKQVHQIKANINDNQLTLANIEANEIRCPDPKSAALMIKLIKNAKKDGNSLGGVIGFKVSGCLAGMGDPVFDKLTADLAKALISIGATRSFEIGLGLEATALTGSEHNDQFCKKNGVISTKTNRSGGVQGGISNGNDILGSVGFKPTATILQKQTTLNKQGIATEFKATGRHDPCVLPRAVPIVEAMINLVLADHLLLLAVSSLTRLKKAFVD
ncbi:MAG: chorismate synthase [SAR324 cluster bacterium]|nr:chorismate synthase [SAR324 cluster bacterium]